MDQNEMIREFYNDIRPDFEEPVGEIHRQLTSKGCGMKLQEAKSGHVVSYQYPQAGKVLANFVSRKTGPVIRVYGDNAGSYLDLLEGLPEALQKKIAKSSDCRRLLDPTKCNARCPMGYDLTIHGERHQKCRYSCFMFPVTAETLSHIKGLLEQELTLREA